MVLEMFYLFALKIPYDILNDSGLRDYTAGRKVKGNNSAISGLSCNGHSAAVDFHDSCNNGKPHTGAFKLRFGVQPGKYLKQLVPLTGIKTSAVIPDGDSKGTGMQLSGNFDSGDRFLSGKLNGIAEDWILN